MKQMVNELVLIIGASAKKEDTGSNAVVTHMAHAEAHQGLHAPKGKAEKKKFQLYPY